MRRIGATGDTEGAFAPNERVTPTRAARRVLMRCNDLLNQDGGGTAAAQHRRTVDHMGGLLLD